MAFCNECGASLPEDVKFCSSCGKPVTAAPAPEPVSTPAEPMPAASTPVAPPPAAPPVQQAVAASPQPQVARQVDSRTKPIGTVGYILTLIAYGLPIIGLILCIVWACSSSVNINRRNLSRALLFFTLVGIILAIVFGSFFMVTYNHIMQLLQEMNGITQ